MLCDLHLHSCLSPCADDDMTPYNLVAMASLKGLGLLALTDHNSAENCAAAAEVAAALGVGLIAGMEVTTAEEVHVLCLFPSGEAARGMGELVLRSLPPIANKPTIFGRQLKMDAADTVLAEEPRLLTNACALSLTELPGLVHARGGLVIPAHVTRPSGGLLPMLGAFPPDLDADAVECGAPPPVGLPSGLPRLSSSDAHSLTAIFEPEAAMRLPLASADFAGLRAYLKAARG